MYNYNKEQIFKIAKDVISTEQKGLESLKKETINDEFIKAVDLILNTKGKVIVSGMGKSGHIANKIAATLASTGTSSFFVHPSEALHGDLGMIDKKDSLIVVSNSGQSKELEGIINYAVKFNIPLIAVTANINSDLAKAAMAVLLLPNVPEACPLGKAPTTSTTMSLVIGDTLAVTLLNIKGFSSEDFKVFHPGGSLGASLMKLKDVMHKDKEVPITKIGTKMTDALINITSFKFGSTAIVNEEGVMVGVITDGDIRRHMSETFLKLNVEDIMSKNFFFLKEDNFVSQALALMQSKSITTVFILDEKKHPIGIIHMHDLINFGVI